MKNYLFILSLIIFSCDKKEIDITSNSEKNAPLIELNNSTSSQPNILLVIADDMGLDATPGYPEGSIKPNMPNLQSLANSGVTFNNAWAYPQCSPTRASILTGKYGYRTGVLNATTNGTISLSEKSLHTYINEQTNNAYATALIGKWHLSNGVTDAETMGADYYAGILGGRVTPNYNQWDFTENGQTTSTTDYVTTKLTDTALNWINQQSQPWFCWLAYNAPHTPFHLPPSNMHSQGNLPTDNASINANPTPYYMAMMESIDFELGRIESSLPQAVWDNTVIIFIGDNGTAKSVIQAPYARAQGKGSLYQGGVNVPLIVSGNSVTRNGESDSSLVNSTDLFATIAEIAGSSSSSYQDSFSFKSLLSAQNTGIRNYNYSEYLGTTARKTGFTIRDNQYKYIEFDNGATRFYDLSNDPYENSNIRTRNLTNTQQAARNNLISEANLIRQ